MMKVRKWCLYCARAGRCKVVTAEKVMEGFYCRNYAEAVETVIEGRELAVNVLGARLAGVAIAAPRR